MSNWNTPRGTDEKPQISQGSNTTWLLWRVSTDTSKIIQGSRPVLDIETTQKSILEKIKNFPISKKTIETLKRITTTEITYEELFRVIKSEHSVVSKILTVANSPMYWQWWIPTIERAMIYLWFKIVYKITVGCLASNEVDVDMSPYWIHIDDFAILSWNQCAILEKWIDPKLDNVKWEIQLASFLQEVGKIIIAMIITENKLTKVFEWKIKEYWDISLAEEYILWQTTADITALIFSKWNLDKKMIEYIRYSDKPENAPEEFKIWSQTLKIIKTLAPISNKWFNNESNKKAIELADNYWFSLESLELNTKNS